METWTNAICAPEYAVWYMYIFSNILSGNVQFVSMVSMPTPLAIKSPCHMQNTILYLWSALCTVKLSGAQYSIILLYFFALLHRWHFEQPMRFTWFYNYTGSSPQHVNAFSLFHFSIFKMVTMSLYVVANLPCRYRSYGYM